MNTKFPTKPAAKTSKLCSHALNGGCHFGAQCQQEHPRDVEAAKLEQSTKKTLNLCGFFNSPSGCTRPGCTFLHVALVPKSAPAKAASSKAPPKGDPRIPPSGKTPSRPAQKGAREKKERAEPRRGKGSAEPRREEPEAFRELHRTRGKINTLRKVAESFRTLHAQLPGGGFLEKAEQADAMLAEITEKVKLFNSGIDQYLIELGQKVDEDDGVVSVDDPDTDGEPDVDPDTEPGPNADGAAALLTSGDHL
jgi:hypothetical protein